LLAPSLAGVLLSVGALALFLARHPYKLVVKDWRTARRGQRTILAERFALFYFLIAVLTVGLAINVGGVRFLLPLALAAPIAIIQLLFDSAGRSRSLAAELAGSIATGSLATAIAISGGWPLPTAFALWVIMTSRSAPTILYLRARLRLLRQKPASTRVALGAHVLAVLVIIVLAWKEIAPWLAIFVMGILLVRASLGFLSTRRITPQRLGVGELLFGILTVAGASIGYGFGW
jgi:hypothetical protein